MCAQESYQFHGLLETLSCLVKINHSSLMFRCEERMRSMGVSQAPDRIMLARIHPQGFLQFGYSIFKNKSKGIICNAYKLAMLRFLSFPLTQVCRKLSFSIATVRRIFALNSILRTFYHLYGVITTLKRG